MGLSDENIAYRPDTWFGWMGRIFFSSLIASFFWAAFNVTVRGVQADPTPSVTDSLPPAFIASMMYLLLSAAFLKVNGGFIYWAHVFVLYVIGALAYVAGIEHTYIENGVRMQERIFASSDKFVKRLHGLSVFWYSVAMLFGFFIGTLFAWGITDGWPSPATNLAKSVYAPGEFDDPSSGFVAQAIVMESLGMTLITASTTYFYLINRASMAPIAGALAVFVSTLLAFNISGGAFDIAYWFSHHVAVCASGSACFAGASAWWWVYFAGSLGGSIIGVILAMAVFLLSPLERKAATAQSGVASAAQAVTSARQQYASRSDVGAGVDSHSVPLVAAGSTGGPTSAATAALFGAN